MNQSEYKKYILGEPNDQARAQVLREAVRHAKEKGGRTTGFYSMPRKQLDAIVRKQRDKS